MHDTQTAADPQQWRVSAPHGRPPRPYIDEPRRPYGTGHARQVGDTSTACGLPAAGWPFFWELAFDPGDAGACTACANTVAT